LKARKGCLLAGEGPLFLLLFNERIASLVPDVIGGDEDHVNKPPNPQASAGDQLENAQTDMAEVKAIDTEAAEKYGKEKSDEPIFGLRWGRSTLSFSSIHDVSFCGFVDPCNELRSIGRILCRRRCNVNWIAIPAVGCKIRAVSAKQFPSGPWTGFYNYDPKDKHRMDLHLGFANGIMTGDGNDDVGRFLIRGKYDEASGECTFHKTYVGSHTVFYRGFREGKGIWGAWEISLFAHGGFHIWPLGSGTEEEQSKAVEEPKPVDAIAVSEVPAPAAVMRVRLDCL
jgi:hypothetical protein